MKCPTCLESFNSSKSTVTTDPCGHLFHEDCIRPWLETGKRTCPKCRTEISRKKLLRVYVSSSDGISEIQDSPRKRKKKKSKKTGCGNPNISQRNQYVASFYQNSNNQGLYDG